MPHFVRRRRVCGRTHGEFQVHSSSEYFFCCPQFHRSPCAETSVRRESRASTAIQLRNGKFASLRQTEQPFETLVEQIGEMRLRLLFMRRSSRLGTLDFKSKCGRQFQRASSPASPIKENGMQMLHTVCPTSFSPSPSYRSVSEGYGCQIRHSESGLVNPRRRIVSEPKVNFNQAVY